ncbi:hypothetical protein HYX02_06185 [Candidatus Woesearchaeota archaeon]|nr:hypothetical protein [Candidatus Woesearchaeota archaeon]
MIKTKKILILMGIFALLIPLSYSNGGCIKIADDIFVQLSSAPLVPTVNQQASFLISFGNKEGLIREEINGKLKIVKNEEIILIKDFKIKDGIFDLKHTFKNAGLYEIFLEFNVDNKKYMPEDFLIEVKEEKQSFLFNIIFFIVGIFIGMILMKLVKNNKK